MSGVRCDLGGPGCRTIRLGLIAVAAGLTATFGHAGRALDQPDGAGAPRASRSQGGAGRADGPPRVHDPAIAKEGGVYYLFSTGRGVNLFSSEDLLTWRRRGRVFERGPDWAAGAVPGWRGDHWAPDISRFGGEWRLYYSVSTFGKNRSAIGLASNATLDPDRPDYRWEDEGLVVESTREDDWNAIDPNVAFDEAGRPWLAFGSFWGGIKLAELDPSTGKPPGGKPRLFSLASRPRDGGGRGAIEAPFIVHHGNYYYLFVSFDFCCRGAASTYNIRVGRAEEIVGPYVDRDGTPMRDGGGTLIREGAGRWRGPGHNAVCRDGDTYWLVYHAYDAEDRGISKLRVEPLEWDEDSGWPRATGRVPSEKADHRAGPP